MNREKWIVFSNAILQGQGETFVDSFLEAGHEINALEKNGLTVLSNAAEFGNLSIVKYLVQIGASATIKNSDGSIPLHIAAKCGYVDIVEFFYDLGVSTIDSCDNDNYTPLHFAAESGRSRFEVAQFLVNNNADINAKTRQGNTPLLLAARHWKINVVELLISAGADVECCDENKWALLHYASDGTDYRWIEIVQSLVDKKCNLNVKTPQGKTPLWLAMRRYHKEIVELLIKSGADVDCCDNKNWAVLHQAALNGCLETVKSLVDRKCYLNAKTCYEDTPLLLAAERRHIEIVEFLIKSGADVEGSYSCTKWTLLHYASHEGWLDILKSILKTETNLINTVTSSGDTPLSLACDIKSVEIITYLLKAGADWNDKMSVLIEDLSLKDPILKDIEICTQAIINNFNNIDLPSIYKLNEHDKRLPPIEKLKITHSQNVKCEIERSVECGIQTKGYCNLKEVRPMVLQMWSVKTLINCHL